MRDAPNLEHRGQDRKFTIRSSKPAIPGLRALPKSRPGGAHSPRAAAKMAGERERREFPQCQALHGGAVRLHAATGSGNKCQAEGAGQEEAGWYWLLWRLSGVRPFATVARQAPLSVEILQARILAWVAISFCRGSSDSENEPISALQAEFFFY